MKKTGKIALAMITALTLVSCGTDAAHRDTFSPLSGRMPHRDFRWSQYAPTGLRDTSSHSSLNFAELEKEYKSFKTKALADTYVKKMFNKFLIVTPNSVQVIRQVEFSRYLKNNGDTSYETSLKNIFTDTPVLYSSLTGMPAVQSKMTSESGTFGFYILGVSPNQTVPNALPATNVTETSFTANWSAVTGATSYTLILDGVEITGITGTNHTLNTLTAGSNHKYRVKAITSGVAGAASNEINVNTVLTAPVASSATGITQTSLTANWSTVTGATSYTLVFNGTTVTGITGTSHTVNSLTPGTGYSYYVKAVNANTESVNSSTINTVTVPAIPTANSASSITSTSFTANWTAVTGATGYTLTVPGVGTYNLIGSTLNQVVTTLQPYTDYSYTVTANNSGGSSLESNSISVKTIPSYFNGFIAYYPFNGNTSDASGNGLNGINFGATLTTDRLGNNNQAYDFNGSSYIEVLHSSLLHPSNQISFSSWVYSGNYSSFTGFTGIVSKTEASAYNLSFNDIVADTINVNVKRNGAYGTVITNLSSIMTPGWHFLTATYDGRYTKLYVDGVLKGTNDAGAQYPIQYSVNNSLMIGAEAQTARTPESASRYTGKIDEVAIHNRALTAQEILDYYNYSK